MEAGEEGKEGAAQHCDFLKDMQQVRLERPDLNPGLPNPHPPAHTRLCSQEGDQPHCTSNQAHASPFSKNK